MDDLTANTEIPPAPTSYGTTQDVDENKCVVTSVIGTDAVDTYGDIVVPAGVMFDLHRENPVVMYAHGIGMGTPDSPGHIRPVGAADTEDGEYTVKLVGDMLIAKTRFSQIDPFARNIFGLYAEKILRAWSVNVIPVYGKWDRLDDKKLPGGKLKQCYRYNRSMLKEYSACALGVNPEALTIAVQRGMIGGEPIQEILRASLNSYCLPRATNLANGISIERAEGVAVADEKKNEAEEEVPTAEKKTEDESAETKKEEGEEDLKAGPKGMLDSLQTIRDHRLANAQKHHATEDEGAMSAHEEIDGHLAEAEEIGRDYLVSKGHKDKDLPEAADFEKIKSMCKSMKGETTAGGDGDATAMVMRGSTYRPARFGMIRAATGGSSHEEISEEDQRLIDARLKQMERRLRRGRSRLSV